MISASFAAMDVNIALGLLAALVFTLQTYNSEGRNIKCRQGQHNLQKRSGEDVVILEGYEVTPQDQERGVGCEEHETAGLFPTPPSEAIRGNQVPQMPAPTSKIPPKKQLCWMYYGTPVRLYLPMRNLPNSQGNNKPYTGGMSGNTQARVVCGKPMGNFPKNYSNGQGKQNNNGAGAIKPVVVRPGMAFQVPGGKSTNFYNIFRNYQRLKAAERPSSISSRCT
ncbi:uncharacterized protein [Danio rerio]|uniref:Uncharacterized protein n=1 Tax=Danio rerio TaxID=7955 RepID=A0A8M2B796_DANRE|nr:uncharacterized protein LOC101885315 [Danio rerio]|eukprot:XP_005160159.2 uncharacterized protein LOC101885315 [Danio rerio]